MKKIIALLLAGTIVLSTPIMAGATTSPDPEYYKRKYDELSQDYEEMRTSMEQMQQQSEKMRTDLTSQLENLRNQLAQANQAVQAAQQAMATMGKGTVNNTTNNITNNYTYKITVKTNGKKTPKIKITGGNSNTGGVSLASEPFVHTVLKAPGLDCVTPVGQGGKLVINGCKTRATFVMRETTSAKVSSAKVLGAQIGGTVKNVVETYAPGVRFGKVQVDFKVYGAHNGDIYRVYQMGPNGTWQEVQVDEVREGHVICTVYKTGTFAFFKMN